MEDPTLNIGDFNIQGRQCIVVFVMPVDQLFRVVVLKEFK
jgi:hypothetical protein